MAELCAECPVTTCEKRVAEAPDSPYQRLAAAWIQLVKVDKLNHKQPDSPGPTSRICTDEDEVPGSVEFSCCTKGAIEVTFEIVDAFQGTERLEAKTQGAHSLLYNDDRIYLPDCTVNQPVTSGELN